MSANLEAIGVHKVKSVFTGQSVELKTFWKDQDTLVIFFRRWGCMFCRLWAKELSEIAPILQKNKVKLIGVGVEETGAKEFAEGNFFDGELYYVEDINTYQTLGFKRFNIVSILTSLFWKQSRDAISKGRSMGLNSDLVGDGLQSGGALLLRRSGVPKHFIQNGVADHMPNMDIIESAICKPRNSHCYVGLGGDMKGDKVQTGGALLVGSGGTLKAHFVQTGPAEHLPNLDILKYFGLESEFKPETMTNQPRSDQNCPYCLSTKPFRGSVKGRTIFKLDPESKFSLHRQEWEIDLLGRRQQNMFLLETQFPQHEDSNVFRVENGKEHADPQNTVEGDPVDRSDHYSQLVPEAMINTDNEITSITGTDEHEDENDASNSWADKTFFPKYT